LIEVKNN